MINMKKRKMKTYKKLFFSWLQLANQYLGECWQVIEHLTSFKWFEGSFIPPPLPTTHLVGANSVLFCQCTLECTLGFTKLLLASCYSLQSMTVVREWSGESVHSMSIFLSNLNLTSFFHHLCCSQKIKCYQNQIEDGNIFTSNSNSQNDYWRHESSAFRYKFCCTSVRNFVTS